MSGLFLVKEKSFERKRKVLVNFMLFSVFFPKHDVFSEISDFDRKLIYVYANACTFGGDLVIKNGNSFERK